MKRDTIMNIHELGYSALPTDIATTNSTPNQDGVKSANMNTRLVQEHTNFRMPGLTTIDD